MHSLANIATFLGLLAATSQAYPSLDVVPGPRDTKSCFPAPRTPSRAPLMSAKYPYTGAKMDGKNGTGVGGILVPALGDKDHEFRHPPPGAYRGPCPGMNVAANHGFISRDGFTTYDELVAMHQNMYNIGYDLSVALSTLAIASDGNIHTDTLSIGPDPSCLGLGNSTGLWYHDSFETDTSLTRDDYYLHETNDNYSFNGTLFRMMRESMEVTSNTTDRSKIRFDKKGMTSFRGQRWDQCKEHNAKFHFGVNALILYGASSFLFEVYPGEGGQPDVGTISAFFGAQENQAGGYDFVDERIPAGWRNPAKPYTLFDLVTNIRDQYVANWRPLGHNEGFGNFFPDERQFPKNGTAVDMMCLLYNQITDNWPGPKNQPIPITNYVKKKLNAHFAPYCNVSAPTYEPEDAELL